MNGHLMGKNYGKSPFLMGKSLISMAIFNSYVSHCQRLGMPGFDDAPRNDGPRLPVKSSGAAQRRVPGRVITDVFPGTSTIVNTKKPNNCLVVWTILKNMSQWEGLSHILWKINNVWNHQPDKHLKPFGFVWKWGIFPNK